MRGDSVDSRKEQDKLLLDNWRRTQSRDDFQKLYRNYQGLINNASRRAAMGSNIPAAAFKLQAAQQFQNVLQTYDEKKGASLQTFLFRHVNDKLKRLNYNYHQLSKIPERSGGAPGVYHINELKNTKEILGDKLNRPATHVELAQEMNMTPKGIQQLEREIRKNLSFTAELENVAGMESDATEREMLSMLYYDMNPEQQLIWEHISHFQGTPILKPGGMPDYPAIARKTKIPLARVQRIRGEIFKMIKDLE